MPQQAISSHDFMNAFGVNIHASYSNTPYGNSAQVLNLLKNLHVHHVRDGLFPWAAGDPMYAFHASLKTAGISSIAVIAYDVFSSAEHLVDTCNLAGNIEALECLNEPDIDTTLTDWVAAFDATLAIVREAATTLGIPVIGPALVKAASTGQLGIQLPGLDIGNVHAYFGGRNPETAAWGPNGEFTMSWCRDQAQWLVASEQAWITETGYVAPESGVITPYETSQGVAAAYSVRTVLEALRWGFQRVYFYELIDQAATGDGYGLATAKYVPKIAYTALRHLQELIGDWSAKTFSPGTLEYALPWGYHSLLIEVQNGPFWIIGWPTDAIYDPAINTAVAPTQNPCTDDFSIGQNSGYEISLFASIGTTGALVEIAVADQPLAAWTPDDGSIIVAKVVKSAK